MSEERNLTQKAIDFLLFLSVYEDCPVEQEHYTSVLERAAGFATSEGQPLVMAQRRTLEVLSRLLVMKVDIKSPKQNEELLVKAVKAILPLLEISTEGFLAVDTGQLPIPFEVPVGTD